ncbi:MAG: hypothetical protein IV100_05885 [Myxococcales bacterium]|nr:hypothetical protein [Myxococcales bacterium]
MKKRFYRMITASAAVLAVGCGDTTSPTATTDAASDGTTAADATDAVDATDGTDAVDATDGTDAVDATDGTDAVDATDGTDAVDATDGTDAVDTTDGTDAVDATDGMDGMDGGMNLAEPSPATQALFDAIEGYAAWPKFEAAKEKTLSASHMNMWVVAYHNDVVTKALADSTFPLPVGSILVKENFAGKDDAMPMALTVMEKTEMGWYWLEGTPNGKVIVGSNGKAHEGHDVPMCSSCHKSDVNDGVLIQPLPGAEMPGMKTGEASADSKALFDAIDGYESWSKFTEMQTRQKSASHMGMWVMAYYNAPVQAAIDSGTLPLPVGSIIVKENFMGETDQMPMALTVMEKRDNGWYWLQGTPDGKVVLMEDDTPLEGPSVAMCTSCHNASVNDGVLIHQF